MPLSEKQLNYLALAWQCFDSEPKIDYEKFYKVAGLASAASGRELLRVTKKKLKEEYGALGGCVDNTPKPTPKKLNANGKAATPGTGGGRKRGRKAATEVNGEGGSDDEEMETPSRKKKAKVEKGVNGDRDGDVEEVGAGES